MSTKSAELPDMICACGCESGGPAPLKYHDYIIKAFKKEHEGHLYTIKPRIKNVRHSVEKQNNVPHRDRV